MVIHLVAHALIGQKPLADPAAADWLWRRLRRAFPNALAACLMPNHVHIIVSTRAADEERRRLAKLLGAASRRARSERTWITAPPARVGDARQLARQIRYVHLNPCRAGIVADPLAYRWSTHRGAVGAELDPWVTPERLAAALGRSRDGFESWLHAFVSGDPSVAPEGTPFPEAATSRSVPEIPLDEIARAAIASTPWSRRSVQRKVVVLLAKQQGWTQLGLVARVAGVSVSQASRYAQSRSEALIRPATLCLGDERLVARRAA